MNSLFRYCFLGVLHETAPMHSHVGALLLDLNVTGGLQQLQSARPATAKKQQFSTAVVRLNVRGLMWEVVSIACKQRRLNFTALRQLISCEVRHSARKSGCVSKDSLTKSDN